jgi:dynein light chain 1
MQWVLMLCLTVVQVIKRLPNLKKLDGIPVDVDEREQAKTARGG